MSDSSYFVVARRYRPQSFEELVGQGQVSTALGNAINSNRVGHAYLFTGARGVGKTSTARILAKALNCSRGPTTTPCNECDICQSISTGEDVDVMEIDGASNRGIDEIRQLRSNVNIRPSRARFKIYIIDEVHMLTNPAFNALLKTLEEPPEHVKFIFCTTDPEKIPITVLSRCQRFDFAPVETGSIVDRLRHIVQSEGIEADDEALQTLARRAAGSMRDSQSLLEQLLSFCQQKITTDDVHAMLGTAQSGRISVIVGHLIDRNAAAALAELETVVNEGVDVGQFGEQLLGYFRDMMAAAVGCQSELMLHSGTDDFGMLVESGQRMGLETVLAAVQILDQTLVRMKLTTQVRTLVEVALVRICKLEDLDAISQAIAQLKSGETVAAPSSRRSRPVPDAAAAQKKTNEIVPKKSTQPSHLPQVDESVPVESADAIWQQTLAEIEDMTSDYASFATRRAISAPNTLVVSFPAAYTLQKEQCEKHERKLRLEETLSRIAGRPMRIDFRLNDDTVQKEQAVVTEPAKPKMNRRQKMREKESHPLVRHAMEVFDAEMIRMEEPRRADVAEPSVAGD